MDNAIEARGLVKTYRGGVRALDGVSLAVETGSVFGLLGPNGAGKSTAVKILTTLSRPDTGEAFVAGHDVLRHPAKVRLAIGCVAQKSGLDLQATGRENLLLQGRVYGMRGAALHSRAQELIDRFGLAEAADRTVRTYSGGMQRKLDVAVGLMHRPQVLFLDEPTTGLDPEARVDMWNEIARLAGDEGLTILMTTHYLEEADGLARRLAIVDRGRVVAEGTPLELKVQAGTASLVATVTHARDLHGARTLLAQVSDEVFLDHHSRTLTLPAGGLADLTRVAAMLDESGIAIDDLGLSRPSLDDVFLSLTGHRAETPSATTELEGVDE